MSGLCGHVRFDGQSIELASLRRMTDRMSHRGPDGISHWINGGVGLGHCLLRTTEEAFDERQPLRNEGDGLVLVFDGWLQNWTDLREELLSRGTRLRNRSDSELVLRSYEVWGREFLWHLHGDFALAIWDARHRQVICARDRIGMRPFNYTFSASLGFRFASEPAAVLDPAHLPPQLNYERIADAIVLDLEGVDQTSTFYRDIQRLPPAHFLVASKEGVRVERYWSLEIPETMRERRAGDYIEGFREVLTDAVRCRLRGGASTATMLSGGLDSSSVTGLARTIRAAAGGPSLDTYSAVAPDPAQSTETEMIHLAAGMDGIVSHRIDYRTLGDLRSDLTQLTLDLPTPFDRHMTLVRSVYLLAQRRGTRAILDGVGGDLVLNSSGYLARLIRHGRWITAWREAEEQRSFYGWGPPAAVTVLKAARAAAIPGWLRNARRNWAASRGLPESWAQSLISGDLASRTHLRERYALARSNLASRFVPGSTQQRAAAIFDAHTTAARERYEREAARLQIEPRDPFLDVRVINYCLSLPIDQMVHNGWTKHIMRRAMEGVLPDGVRWRRGREHLGWSFTSSVMQPVAACELSKLKDHAAILASYLNISKLRDLSEEYLSGRPLTEWQQDQIYMSIGLSRWLQRHEA